MSKFAINTIVRPLATFAAHREYSDCGHPNLIKAKVVDTFACNAKGNNISIEVIEHVDKKKIGKTYKVNDSYFEAIEQEWIWVDAYKATDANMVCKGKQYVMNVVDNYSGDKVVLGSKGYHVCTNLYHCFYEYPNYVENRYFKVHALVRKTDYDHRNPFNTTLVAKAIQFVEEITTAPDTVRLAREYASECAREAVSINR